MTQHLDIQWVTWNSIYRGKFRKGKWHARVGFARGPKATMCGQAISPLDSIGMERLGAWRKTDPPKDKKRVCTRCLAASKKLNEQLELGDSQ